MKKLKLIITPLLFAGLSLASGFIVSGVGSGSGSGTTSPLTTKGDIWVYSNTDARLAVGTNNYVLAASSGAATGLAWTATTSLPVAFGQLTGATTDNASLTTALGLKQNLILKNVNTTSVGNVGTGEDNLMTYALTAGTLAATNDHIRIKAFGTLAATANNKVIKCYFGSQNLLTSPTLSTNDGSWEFNSVVIRTGAATQRSMSILSVEDAMLLGGNVFPDYTTPTETLSGAVTIKCTGEATDNDDIVQTGLIVEYYAAP